MDGTLRQILVFENIQWPTGRRHDILHPNFQHVSAEHPPLPLQVWRWTTSTSAFTGPMLSCPSSAAFVSMALIRSLPYLASKTVECLLLRPQDTTTVRTGKCFKVARRFFSRPAPPLQHRHLWGLHIRGHIYEQLCLPGQQVWQRPNGESHYRHQPRYRYCPASPLQAAREWALRILCLRKKLLASHELIISICRMDFLIQCIFFCLSG